MLEIELTTEEMQTRTAIYASLERAMARHAIPLEVGDGRAVCDASGKLAGSWAIVESSREHAGAAAAAAPVSCCCGATATPAPSMPAVLSMPTAAELASIAADVAGLGRSLADMARELASMASVARMPRAVAQAWQPVAISEVADKAAPADAPTPTPAEVAAWGILGPQGLSGCAVAAATPPAENVHARITSDGTVADAAGPTGSPRRRNLATRPTASDMVYTLVVETRAHGKQAASVLFERMQAKYSVNSEEAKAIARRVRAELGADGGAGEPRIL